ncbi:MULTISPECIES: sugar ABC transporter permease [Nocardiopsis]|uniref:Xylose transport system permease protein XylH n=1 Tax=Nocardiopsis sinuspersici TaxID=501010 RepID=A0A1V3C0X7_9ACTN|nr:MULTISPECIES: ABC transporter permease [Nocardiopsis]NYH50564.1 D-xylose transport system permease protein [Nocardiopsis sinuspersici]OOC54454.1 ABC transporter permease [Nocardiopsis sinuspersici]
MTQQTPVSKAPAQGGAEPVAPKSDPRLLATVASPKGWLDAFKRRMRGGELGPLPVVIGLILIAVVFQSANDRFLSPQNLSNLTVQIAAIGLMTTGVIMVLLLGEIDLSIGSVAGLAAAVLGVVAVKQGVSEWAAIGLAIGIGLLVGLVHGFVFAKLGVPAFVVTLAGLLGWQGLHLYLMGADGTINTSPSGPIALLTQTFFVPVVGWSIAVLALGLYVLAVSVVERRRRLAGLPHKPLTGILLRTAVLALPILGGVWVLNQYKGVPLAFLIFVGFVVVLDLVLRKTRYGRMVYAVGGNSEAARRAGINVDMIRISVFGIASALAAMGGVLLTSRNFAASVSTGGGEELMMAIAAAVIGGTSLFGGRGNAYSALLGGLVLGTIASGLLLLQMNTSVRFMITAGVLLVAVILDSLSRRGRKTHARGGA